MALPGGLSEQRDAVVLADGKQGDGRMLGDSAQKLGKLGVIRGCHAFGLPEVLPDERTDDVRADRCASVELDLDVRVDVKRYEEEAWYASAAGTDCRLDERDREQAGAEALVEAKTARRVIAGDL